MGEVLLAILNQDGFLIKVLGSQETKEKWEVVGGSWENRAAGIGAYPETIGVFILTFLLTLKYCR